MDVRLAEGGEMVTVRLEGPADHAAVQQLYLAQPGGKEKADLVAVVRSEARPPLSLVAVAGEQVIGHVILSPVGLHTGSEVVPAVLVGPMAVAAAHAGQGVESRLVTAAMEEARAVGHVLVFAVGEADLFAPLGFEPAAPRGVRSEYEGLDPNLMAAELRPGALGGRSGVIKYPSRTWVM